MKDLTSFKPTNLIIRLPNWVGDVVLATPLLTDLRRAFPDATITAMCLDYLAPLIQTDLAINELFCFSQNKGFLRRIRERNVIAKLKAGKYDLGILTTNSFSSAWLFWQGKVRNIIGFKGDGRSFFLNYPLPFPKMRTTQHITQTYKELLCPLGIPYSTTPPRLFLTKQDVDHARDLVKQFDIRASTLIGINPAAAYGSAKKWPLSYFRSLAFRLIQTCPSCAVLFFGDFASRAEVAAICSGLPSQVINLAGRTTLRELMALIQMCSVFVTNDSGPMHIADAFEVPVVALFGSTDPVVTGPYRRQGKVIFKQVECSPCFKKVCPTHFMCMKSITADEVLEAVLSILKQPASQSYAK